CSRRTPAAHRSVCALLAATRTSDSPREVYRTMSKSSHCGALLISVSTASRARSASFTVATTRVVSGLSVAIAGSLDRTACGCHRSTCLSMEKQHEFAKDGPLGTQL